MITRFIRFYIFTTVLLASVIPSRSQQGTNNGYYVQHFTDENGLPQNSINDLLFDDEGFLWLGSQVGLVRFNGYAFKLYYPDDKPIMESDVTMLGKNEKGPMFFQTRDHNLYSYSGTERNLLSPVNTVPQHNPRLLSGGKRIFDFTHFLQSSGTVDSTKRQQIFRDLFQQNRNFFVVDTAHVYFINRDTLYYYDEDELHKLSILNSREQCLVLDKKLFVLRRDSVTEVYSNGQFIHGPFAIGGDLLTEAPVLREGKFRLFPSGETNHLLAGGRLYRIDRGPGGELTTRYLLDLSFVRNITGMEYNEEHNLLLVATGTEGFYSFRKSRFLGHDFSPALQDRLSGHLFGAMALLDSSTILTDNFLFDAKGKTALLQDSTPIWQKGLYVDSRQHLWSAVYNIPRKLTRDGRVLSLFPALDGQIVDYQEDAEGQFYCVTTKTLWQLEADSFHRVVNLDSIAPGGLTECSGHSGPNQFWMGGTFGLLRYDRQTNSFTRFPLLTGAHVRSIHVCKDGTVLVGTYGQGYYYYRHDRLFRMPLGKNGFLITAHCFLEDNKNNIWISCNKGLFKVPKADLDAWCDSLTTQIYYYYFGRQDGLRTNEFNGGYNASGLITRDGFVSLLSMKGIVCFQTDSLRSDFPRGRIDISNVEIDGRWCPRTNSITLSPDYNNLLLEISCPYLGNRNNLYLEYSLKGLNDQWQDLPDNGDLNLSRLAPGNYTLRVRKVSGFGPNNYAYRELDIIVSAHVYQKTWFKWLMAFLLVLLLGLLIQLWLKLSEKQKEVRSKAEKLKRMVMALENTVQKLQESEKALLQTSRMRERMISLVIHDLRSPLRFLTMLAGNLHDNLPNMSDAEMKERTYWVKKSTNDIYNFSEDFLLWVTSQKDNFSIRKHAFPLEPLFQEMHDFFREQVQQKGNTILYEVPPGFTIYSDPHILITVIRNLVDNANKYTEKGSILLRAYQEESSIVIAVSDTGRGMSPDQVKRFLENESLDDVKSGTQLGHKFILDLTQRMPGTISIESREGEGTTVKLRFPIDPSAPANPSGHQDTSPSISPNDQS